jgi:MAP/microtubule affinity-regulating kinase
VWSLGVILYTLVSGTLPFDGANLKELRDRVLRGKYRIPFYMSTDCENLLKKFLVLNPAKRASLETIMKDKWMNIGYEDDELRPYAEPEPDYADQLRVATLTSLGYSREEIEDSLRAKKYDDVMANYLLLIKKQTENSEPNTVSSSSLDVLMNGITLNGSQSGAPGTVTGPTGTVLQSPGHVKVQRSISAAAKPRRFSHGGHAIGSAVGSNAAAGGAAGANITAGADATVITNNQAIASSAGSRHSAIKKDPNTNGAAVELTTNGSSTSSNGTHGNGPAGFSKQESFKMAHANAANNIDQTSSGSASSAYGASSAAGKLPTLGSLRLKSAATSPNSSKGTPGTFSAIPRRNTYNYSDKSPGDKARIHASNSSNASNVTATGNGSSENATTPTKCVFFHFFLFPPFAPFLFRTCAAVC